MRPIDQNSATSSVSPILSWLLLAILILLSAAPSTAGGTNPVLHLQGDFTDAGALRIGGHLDITISGARPASNFTVVLTDEGGQKVASLVDIETNIHGKTDRLRLWTRTGVVGCDDGAVHDPLHYLFESFDEAESVLGGRTFRVLLLEGKNPSLTAALAEKAVPLVVVTPQIGGYPSDGAGCLRTVFVTEPVFLAVSHQFPGDLELEVFVVQAQSVWVSGDPLIDVRPGGSQIVLVPAGADPWVEMLNPWASSGEFQIIVRKNTPNGLPYYQPGIEILIETGFKHMGSTFLECQEGDCPPP